MFGVTSFAGKVNQRVLEDAGVSLAAWRIAAQAIF
jgi:hypothetical protein